MTSSEPASTVHDALLPLRWRSVGCTDAPARVGFSLAGAIDRSPVHGLEQLTAHFLPRMSVTSVSRYISKNPPMASGALIGPHSRTLHQGDLTRVGIRQVHERNRQRLTQGLLIPL